MDQRGIQRRNVRRRYQEVIETSSENAVGYVVYLIVHQKPEGVLKEIEASEAEECIDDFIHRVRRGEPELTCCGVDAVALRVCDDVGAVPDEGVGCLINDCKRGRSSSGGSDTRRESTRHQIKFAVRIG